MEMIDGLPGILADVDEQSKSVVGDSPIRRHLNRRLDQLSRQMSMLAGKRRQVWMMVSRYHQDVRWRLRSDVVEGDDMLGFVQKGSAELTRGDRAEYAGVVTSGHRMSLSPRFSALRTSFRLDQRKSMPELPEVETVRLLLEPEIVGKTITGVSLGDFGGVLESRIPGLDPRSALENVEIVHLLRRGKYLVAGLSNGLVLIIHLRMTGRILILPAGSSPIRFQHAAIHLSSGIDLRFGDQRKFGRLTIATAEDVARLYQRLGPEPFDRRLTAAVLWEGLRRRPGKIKNALLDQSLIAGLGNIYVDEALFRTRIHPEQPSNSLSVAQVRRLMQAIRLILRLAILRQGTTFASFENPYGEAGENANFLRAYGKSRDGGRCPRCRTPFEKIAVGGRGTTFCPRCQVRIGRTTGAAEL
jgi:formamidopyrimidine-DNA glycosylase